MAVLIGVGRVASGALSYDYSGASVAITDNDPTGLAFNFAISDPATEIVSLEVMLQISGGYNGDLYAYLTHDAGGFAVLLNRPGVGTTTGGSSASGYSDTGFHLTFGTFSPDGAPNVHFYQNHDPVFNGSGQLTGNWQPDGRAIDPESPAGDFEAPGAADFSTFTGVNPSGNWTLFFADLSPGSISTVEDFSVTLTALPEPVTTALGIFVGILGVAVAWRRCRGLSSANRRG